MERSVSSVGFGVVVRLMFGLVFLGWCVEAFAFLEVWPRLLVRTYEINFAGQFWKAESAGWSLLKARSM